MRTVRHTKKKGPKEPKLFRLTSRSFPGLGSGLVLHPDVGLASGPFFSLVHAAMTVAQEKKDPLFTAFPASLLFFPAFSGLLCLVFVSRSHWSKIAEHISDGDERHWSD